MRSRATFGDFATAARRHLEQAIRQPGAAGPSTGTAASSVSADEFTRSLRRLLRVVDRYLTDLAAPVGAVSARDRIALSPQARAVLDGREVLREAASVLRPDSKQGSRTNERQYAGSIRCNLDAATMALTASRDLLHTHLAVGPAGTRLRRSEWAPVVTSEPVARALLHELGTWIRLAAAQSGELSLSRDTTQGAREARSRLATASQHLWMLHSLVQAANHSNPASAADRQMLYAIPVNELPARHLPVGRESVAELCQGTVDSAERVRHLAWTMAPDAVWSPQLSADSLRETAGCATAISHHSAVLLHSLADRAMGQGSTWLGDQLADSAAQAASARSAWLHAARTWENVTTDTRGRSPVATEAADLVLWTGRLAYEDPGWNLSHGPFRPPRSPQSLAPEPYHLAEVVATVHRGIGTLAQLATADETQIRLAARAQRLFSPTRSLPEGVDVPHRYGRTPHDRLDALIVAYRHAGAASARSATTVAAIAAEVGAPSHAPMTAVRSADTKQLAAVQHHSAFREAEAEA